MVPPTFLLFLFLLALASGDKSCETKCSDEKFPRCGAWIDSDNNQLATGVYLLDEGYVNLTCTVNSLPRPTTIRWYFEPEFANGPVGDRIPLTCSSLRTSTECKHNDFGEHKVISVCLLKITRLEQTGSYFCSGQLEKYEDAESSKIRVHAFGIANISLYEKSEYFNILEYGKIGRIRIKICANPKPHLVWVHRPSGRTIATGSSTENETASILYHELDTTNAGAGPVSQNHYCYIAALIIGRVRSHSHAWTVMVWNSVDAKKYDVPVSVVGEPPPPKGAIKLSNNYLYIVLTLVAVGVVGYM